MSRTAIGLKAHTGWASAVVIAERRGRIEVIAKARIAMIDGFDQAAVYHHGHEGGLSAAQARPIIEAAFRTAVERATPELGKLVRAPAHAGILAGRQKPLPDLEVILRAHPLVHAAEGELYRNVLLKACEALGLRAVKVPAKELPRIPELLAQAGAASGKPWAAEQRECALAAWVAAGWA